MVRPTDRRHRPLDGLLGIALFAVILLAAGAWLALAVREPGGPARWRRAAWWALPAGLTIVKLIGDTRHLFTRLLAT